MFTQQPKGQLLSKHVQKEETKQNIKKEEDKRRLI
jgi:hypothetical protein